MEGDSSASGDGSTIIPSSVMDAQASMESVMASLVALYSTVVGCLHFYSKKFVDTRDLSMASNVQEFVKIAEDIAKYLESLKMSLEEFKENGSINNGLIANTNSFVTSIKRRLSEANIEDGGISFTAEQLRTFLPFDGNSG